MALGGFLLGSLRLYLKGMRIMMFQLSGFYYNPNVNTAAPISFALKPEWPGLTSFNDMCEFGI